MTTDLYHVASRDDLAVAGPADYAPPAFADEGFVHCCGANQLAGVLVRHFRARDGLALLELDPAALGAPLVREDTAGVGEDFPHLYGRIPRSAILRTTPFATDAEGVARWDAGAPRIECDGLEVTFHRTPTVAWRRFGGAVVGRNLFDCLGALWSHAEYVYDRPEIYDFSAVDGDGLGPDVIRAGAELNAAEFANAPNFPSAIVVPGPLLHGFVRMFSAYTGERGGNIHIFTDADAALAWLVDDAARGTIEPAPR